MLRMTLSLAALLAATSVTATSSAANPQQKSEKKPSTAAQQSPTTSATPDAAPPPSTNVASNTTSSPPSTTSATTSTVANDPTSTTTTTSASEIVSTTTTGTQASAADHSVDSPPEEKKEARKLWNVGVLFESHHLIRQNDLEGAAANKHVNYYSLYGQINITKNDAIRLTGSAYQRFLVDEGETGWRTGDLSASYRRLVQLPWKLDLSGAARVSLPTSFNSEKASLIAAPGASVALDRKFFKHLNTEIGVYGSGFITRYKEYEGGDPNAKLTGGFSADLSCSMPFHEALSIGTSAILNWTSFYNVENAQDPNVLRTGAVQDSTFKSQPVQQGYGWQAYARYDFPKVIGIGSDLTIAYAQGDSTLGSSAWMHDGVGRFYLFWRDSSQVYASLSARY